MKELETITNPSTANARRIRYWKAAHGDIPQGQVVDVTCGDKLCFDLAHCFLRPKIDLHAKMGWKDYRPIVERVVELPEGDFFDLPDEPNDSRSVLRFKTGLTGRLGRIHILVRSLPSGGLRVIRYGDYYEPVNVFNKAFPVLDNPRAVSPEEKLRRQLVATQLREERRLAREMRFFERLRRLGRQSVWLGQFQLTREDEALLARPRRSACTQKACPYPQVRQGKCRYHAHYFDFKWSMEWRQVPSGDYMPTVSNPQPLLSVMRPWEIPTSADRVVFQHNGTYDRGKKISDDWWNEQVKKYMAAIPKPTSYVRVTSDRDTQQKYADEEKITNVQHTGAFVLWKGFGRKKIRKKQRMRPQGWHGNHPVQKPRERFTRDTLEDIPMWAPPKAVEECNDDLYFDDDGYTTLLESNQEYADVG